MQGLQNTLVLIASRPSTNFDLQISKDLINRKTSHVGIKRRTLPTMKKQGKLHVILPSILATSNAFVPPTMQHPSTYYVTMLVVILTPCLEDHPPYWLLLHKNVVTLYMKTLLLSEICRGGGLSHTCFLGQTIIKSCRSTVLRPSIYIQKNTYKPILKPYKLFNWKTILHIYM
jgi:hypothetical protein